MCIRDSYNILLVIGTVRLPAFVKQTFRKRNIINESRIPLHTVCKVPYLSYRCNATLPRASVIDTLYKLTHARGLAILYAYGIPGFADILVRLLVSSDVIRTYVTTN